MRFIMRAPIPDWMLRVEPVDRDRPDASFDGVSAALEARAARLGERRLLLLRGGLLLRLRLSCRGRILPAALATRRNCTCRCAGARIPADDLAYDGTARGTTNPGARRGAGRRRRRRCGRLLRRRLGRVESGLLDRPGVARRFIAFLLLRRLSFGRIDKLLGACLSGKRQSRYQRKCKSQVHR
jgi:hypothetical protein